MNYIILFFILPIAFIICDIDTNTIDEKNAIDTNDINVSIARNQYLVQDKVRIDLYYECLCPSCKEMYTEEIAPLVLELQNYIELYTYPFGNVKVMKNDDKVTFKCQHGPEECYGNILHACAIRYLPKMSEFVPFNACMMKRNSNDEAADQCGQAFHVDSVPIKTCAKGDEGKKLLIHYAEETAKVKDRHYVPYIIINGKVMSLEESLQDAVCAAFNNPPKKCEENNFEQLSNISSSPFVHKFVLITLSVSFFVCC